MTMKGAETFKTTCSYCGVGCGMVIRRDKRNRLEVAGDPDHPVNRGMLCSKGMNLHHVVQDTSDRLLYPAMRWARHHAPERVSWDTAMQRTAAVFRSLIAKYGPDSVGFYISGQCLTEEYYVANKLVKGFLGTNNIDTNSRLCMSSAVSAYADILGEDAVPVCYDDIELSDCLLIAGANPAWCHPILFRRMEEHKRKRPDVRIVIVDPRKTQSCALADLHLQIRPGTDIYLYNAIGRLLIENGHTDDAFVAGHTEHFEEYKTSILPVSLDEAAAICDVPASAIEVAAAWIGSANAFLSLWAMGLNQSVIGVNKNAALISLHLLTGQIGKPGAGPFSLTGQPNAMGGREVGGLATMLAAHRKIEDPAHREEVAAFWGVPSVPERPGLTATEMIGAMERGELKAVWIICTNPLVTLPDSARVARALERARFVVVQDISQGSETVRFADVILPAAGHMEKEGTMTNAERRISHLPRIISPPGEAKADAEILCMFARAMGFPGFDYASPSQIYDEHRRLTRGTRINISGLSYDRLIDAGTFQWPVPEGTHPGTKRLFTDHRFYTTSGRARFPTLARPRNLSEPLSEDFPLTLTTGRIRDQWHTMTKTGKVSKLRRHIGKPFLEIHPQDAADRDIADGDIVTVDSRRGTVRVCAKISDDIKQGVVFLPMHWGRIADSDAAKTNVLTSTLADPKSKQPDFKFSAVQVAAYRKPDEKIIIVGAGAAAYRFLYTYRSLNRRDTIEVFSREEHPFYNRVLLPEYVTESLRWEHLQKIGADDMEKLAFTLHQRNEITSIDAANKSVVDQYGNRHRYDKLILATGSRANLPHDAPTRVNNVVTMRTRGDADRLRQYVSADAHIVIVGGGLLGVELAVSLREAGAAVTIVQMGSRLMERQIDAIAAQLLLDFIDEKDITVHMNDQLVHVESRGAAGALAIQLRSGRSLNAQALVYATGTRPNIECAQDAGLETARGIIVNDHLQTSDAAIYAIGEIAEHRGKTLGITSAAERQADALARFLHGDAQSVYEGAVTMNILKLHGLDFCSIGLPDIPAGQTGYEEILFIDQSMRYYKKCIVHKDRLVGAVLVGDKTEFAEFRSLIENRTELSTLRLKLLRAGKPSPPVIGRLICSCNHVGEGNLGQLIEQGHLQLNELCELSGAGLGCGSCKPEITAILAAARTGSRAAQISGLPAETLT